jgi:hypothetical protein
MLLINRGKGMNLKLPRTRNILFVAISSISVSKFHLYFRVLYLQQYNILETMAR